MKIYLIIALLFVSSAGFAQTTLEEKAPIKRMVNAFDLMKENEEKKQNYNVFMRIPSISSGVYTLKKGAVDGQSAHTKDEIYYIVKGKAKILIGSETFEVGEGSMVFVEAHKDHKFFDISEDLAVVVVFSAEQPKADKP
jgi:mannose-6-phosphate isomerase-like protein (cupin superfamily)